MNWLVNNKLKKMPPKLFLAIMFSTRDIYEKALNDLIEKFGEIKKQSFEYDFTKFTSYYEKEMGKNIIKKIIIFKKHINKEELADIKLFTTEIEEKYSENNKRKINLDPGYLTNKEVVLASFKKGTGYKEQISDKVWVHKVLEFKENKAIEFWHTFPDYKGEEVKEFLLGCHI